MSADVGSSEAEAARNARLHALCSRPMRLIPAFPLSSGEAETGIKALLSHKVTGARVMNRMKDLRPRWHQGIAASSPWSLSDLIWSTDVSNFDQTPVRQRPKLDRRSIGCCSSSLPFHRRSVETTLR
jgi:hypothetical protein